MQFVLFLKNKRVQINSKVKEKVISVSFIITNVRKFAGLKFVLKAVPLFIKTKQ